MTKFKKVGLAITAMTLSAAVVGGATLSYFTHVTETTSNNFTTSKGVYGELTEPGWTAAFPDGNWTDFFPGDSHVKDPQITITPESVEAYVAMKVECSANDSSVVEEAFDGQYAHLDIGYEGSNWVKDNGVEEDFYLYKDIVGKGETTKALFNNVTIQPGIYSAYKFNEEDKGKTVYFRYKAFICQAEIPDSLILFQPDHTGFAYDVHLTNPVSTVETVPDLKIKVTGYAIQAHGFSSYEDAQPELEKLAKVTNK